MNNINNTLNVGGSMFAGMKASEAGASEAAARPRRRATGKLDAADVDLALRCYVTPANYDNALNALYADHIVVLEGEAGSGRAAGAIALLRDVTDRTLVALSPVITLKQLATRDYESAFVYVVIDHHDDGAAADTDHLWRTIRDVVRDAGTYLIVTAAPAAAGPHIEAVHRVPWPKPSLPDLLRAHLSGSNVGDEEFESILSAIPARWGMTSVARLAERIAAGDATAVALDELEVAAATNVRAWFAKERSRRELLSVTALAFVCNVSERTFETVRTQLEKAVAAHLPARKRKGDKNASGDLPGFRLSLADPDGLIAVETAAAAGRHKLTFKVPAYRRLALAELWARYEAPFWDAVREWLNDVIIEYDPIEVAYGLFLLASVNLDEVQQSFLEPWSIGDQGLEGMATAAYLLSWMCYDDSLAPIALQTAVRWTNDGSMEQRWTAALAFTGELGVRYPAEASRRLWQLITSGDDVSEPAQNALAVLFLTLIDAEQDASVILTMLDRHREKFARRGGDERLLTRTMTSLLKVLAVRDARTGRPAIFVFLNTHPDQSRLAAQLWAGALGNARYRRDALQALWDGLKALDRVSAEPLEDARILGAALAEVLPKAEHEQLKKHLTVTDRRAHQRGAEVVVNALLDALERVRRQSATEAEE